jgi:hypothetical protein
MLNSMIQHVTGVKLSISGWVGKGGNTGKTPGDPSMKLVSAIDALKGSRAKRFEELVLRSVYEAEAEVFGEEGRKAIAHVVDLRVAVTDPASYERLLSTVVSGRVDELVGAHGVLRRLRLPQRRWRRPPFRRPEASQSWSLRPGRASTASSSKVG